MELCWAYGVGIYYVEVALVLGGQDNMEIKERGQDGIGDGAV